MRDTWYGDQRDLVKWGTLAHLAERESLDVVQVPFLRLGPRPPLQNRNTESAISPQVWAFFRDVQAVQALGDRLGRRIIVVDCIFEPGHREEYRQQVVTELAGRPQKKVVLLDPDTGIEPERATPKHATVEDVKAVWEVLKQGDWLVLYQHARRRKDWREEALSKFRSACLTEGREMFSAPGIAPDVIFMAVPKGR